MQMISRANTGMEVYLHDDKDEWELLTPYAGFLENGTSTISK